MKILKGSGFDAKRPDRLDVAMCRDLPIKLVAWRRFQMAGWCVFFGVNFSVLNHTGLSFPEKLAERTTFRFSFLRQISQVMRLGGHDSVHDMDFFLFFVFGEV